jgi:hypothetical protein
MTEPRKPVHGWTLGVLQHAVGHAAGTLIVAAFAFGFGIGTIRALQPADNIKCHAIYQFAQIEPLATRVAS